MSSQLELWAEELQHQELVTDGNRAEQMLVIHNESVLHMQNCTFEVLQRGQELAQVNIMDSSKQTLRIFCKIPSFKESLRWGISGISVLECITIIYKYIFIGY